MATGSVRGKCSVLHDGQARFHMGCFTAIGAKAVAAMPVQNRFRRAGNGEVGHVHDACGHAQIFGFAQALNRAVIPIKPGG
jgi:hypothetical protein